MYDENVWVLRALKNDNELAGRQWQLFIHDRGRWYGMESFRCLSILTWSAMSRANQIVFDESGPGGFQPNDRHVSGFRSIKSKRSTRALEFCSWVPQHTYLASSWSWFYILPSHGRIPNIWMVVVNIWPTTFWTTVKRWLWMCSARMSEMLRPESFRVRRHDRDRLTKRKAQICDSHRESCTTRSAKLDCSWPCR